MIYQGYLGAELSKGFDWPAVQDRGLSSWWNPSSALHRRQVFAVSRGMSPDSTVRIRASLAVGRASWRLSWRGISVPAAVATVEDLP
jgi:hypothetical protein